MANYTIEKYHGSYNKTYNGSTSRKYIVVHYTGAGTSAVGCAKNNCIYFSSGNRNASADYFIDDGSIYEYNDPKSGYYSWHCGDGGGAYGITNANSIGIEVCMNGDNPYTSAEIDRLTWLVQKLMKDFNISASNVVRHYDASRKLCPYYYAQRQGEWEKLRAQITGGTVTGSTSSSSSSSSSSTSTPTQNGSITAGTYTVLVDNLNVRTGPTTSASSVAQYNKGEKVTLDGWSTKADGCIWGRYIGASSGQYRYIAVQVEGGATYASIGGTTTSSSSSTTFSSSTTSSVPAGTYKCVVDKLNVRSKASTSGSVVASYTKGQTVNLDNWSTTADGYVWGRYTAYSGATRYIAVRTTSGTPYLQKV